MSSKANTVLVRGFFSSWTVNWQPAHTPQVEAYDFVPVLQIKKSVNLLNYCVNSGMLVAQPPRPLAKLKVVSNLVGAMGFRLD